MSSKIRVLDDQTINKIAAGEVIENPASVIKELVENAIDAESTEICVEIKGGGRQLIRITDDGMGMTEDDALLSLERHATSKIKEVEDILTIGTMGFRGEAVPSIASISKLNLITCPRESDTGTLIIVDGGKIIKTSPAARSPGTTFEVKSLFFNVPVRKKFQRSPTHDANEILKVLSIQALAHPEIKFQLINNQVLSLKTHTAQSEVFLDQLGERISAVLGTDFYGGLCPIEKTIGDYQLSGFIGLPSYTRHNRTGQYLFINKRAVTSPLVASAVREGYGTALPIGRHPIFVLHLTMPGSLVDVNVHPQKREVRLRQEEALREMIITSVEDSLRETGLSMLSVSFSFNDAAPLSIEVDKIDYEKPVMKEPPFVKEAVTEPPSFISSPLFSPPPPVTTPPPPLQQPLPTFIELAPTAAQNLKIISTLPGYLVATNPDQKNITFIDQKAAHSRILYEKLHAQHQKQDTHQGFAIQNLLIPEPLEFTPLEANTLKEHLNEINQLGISIEEFGNNSFVLQGIAQMWAKTNRKTLISDILHNLQENKNIHIVQNEKMKLIARAAARAAVSQNQTISTLEGQNLVNDLLKCHSPHQCPYGKPTLIKMGQVEIAKQFEK